MTQTVNDERYFGDWSDWSAMEKDFRGARWSFGADDEDVNVPVEGMATDAEVLFAAYTSKDYSGAALVVFQRDGKLYEASGSHCSCYGLEGQWSPEETTWAAIAMRPECAKEGDASSYGYGWEYDYTPEGAAALRALVRSHLPAQVPS